MKTPTAFLVALSVSLIGGTAVFASGAKEAAAEAPEQWFFG